jgi:cell wall assembly regulator SMI1
MGMSNTNTSKRVLESFSQRVTLMPGPSREEIAEFQERLPGPLPDDIKELLGYSAGFHLSSVGSVHFTGTNTDFQFANALPFAVTLLADGSGNFWVVDVNSKSGAWGAVFFVSHDPPVVVVQAPELKTFLSQVLDPNEGNPKNAHDDVRKVAAMRIWKEDPWLISVRDARTVQDPVVSNFAKQLPENFGLADLRSREIGSGFSWGLAGPNTEVRRDGAELLFGVEQKAPSFLKRVLTLTSRVLKK